MTVGELRAALADPMLEDRHEVLAGYSQVSADRQNADDREGLTLGARCVTAGLRRALVIETEIVGL